MIEVCVHNSNYYVEREYVGHFENGVICKVIDDIDGHLFYWEKYREIAWIPHINNTFPDVAPDCLIEIKTHAGDILKAVASKIEWGMNSSVLEWREL